MANQYTEPIDPVERFWSHVEFVNGHGLWKLSKCQGYGQFSLRVNGKRKTVKAHKFAWESVNGPVPDGKELGHTCEFRHCVIHVRPVTHRGNFDESNAFQWQRDKTHCPLGHEYTPENTRVYRGKRYCRQCHRERVRARYRLDNPGSERRV